MIKLNGKEINVGRFSNNETNVEDFEEIVNESENVVELKYENDTDLITLMFVKKRIDEFNVPCSLFIWCMPYGRMDRKIQDKLFSLKYICEFINSLNFLQVVVMEPHSEVTMQYLNNAKAVYPVKEWLPIIQKKIGFTDYDCVVFPDEGAAKRYEDCKLKNVCVINKRRDTETDHVRYSYLKEGKVNPDSKCIIVDDICSRGETILHAAKILQSLKISEIYIVVAHCESTILENGFFEYFFEYKTPIKKLYTSTSMMDWLHLKVEYMHINVKKYMK